MPQAQKFRPPKPVQRLSNTTDSLATASQSQNANATRITPVNASQANVSLILNETTSVAVIQDTLEQVIGTIGYLRCLLPEENYTEGKIGSSLTIDPPSEGSQNSQARTSRALKTKILKQGHTLEGDYLLTMLREGVMDAVKRGYLKSLMLIVLTDETKENDIIESYTFNIFYRQGELLGSEDPRKLGASCEPDDVRTQVKRLINGVMKITDNLEDLPSSKHLDMKLFYNASAPADYQAPHFKATSSQRLTMGTHKMAGAPDYYGRGRFAQTGHHGVSFRLLSACNDIKIMGSNNEGVLDSERRRNQQAELKYDADKRRVRWDAEISVIDDMDLDPDCPNPLESNDQDLAQENQINKLRQPLGWLERGGHIRAIPRDAILWDRDDENGNEMQESIGVFPRVRERGDIQSYTARRIPGWSQVTDSQAFPATQMGKASLGVERLNRASSVLIEQEELTDEEVPVHETETEEIEAPPEPPLAIHTASNLRSMTPPPPLVPAKATPRRRRDQDSSDESDGMITDREIRPKRTRRAPKKRDPKPTNAKQTGKGASVPKKARSDVPQTKTKRSKPKRRLSNSDLVELTISTLPQARNRRTDTGIGQDPEVTQDEITQFTDVQVNDDIHIRPDQREPIAEDLADCYCGMKIHAVDITICAQCSKSLHSVCLGLFDGTSTSVTRCIKCLAPPTTDILDIEGKVGMLALTRQILVLCRQLGTVRAVDEITAVLHSPKADIEVVLTRLNDEGFFQRDKKGKKKYPRKWASGPEQNMRMAKYFTPGSGVEVELFDFLRPAQTSPAFTQRRIIKPKPSAFRASRCLTMIDCSDTVSSSRRH